MGNFFTIIAFVTEMVTYLYAVNVGLGFSFSAAHRDLSVILEGRNVMSLVEKYVCQMAKCLLLGNLK